MMPFTERLQYLLEKYDSLIIEGFGGFFTRYQAAQLHPVTHRITPPQKEISFNRNLIHTDGTLEMEFRTSFQVSADEANQLVSGIVSFLNEILQTEGKLNFVGVGEIIARADGNWRFIPFEENHLLMDSFSLYPVQMKPVIHSNRPIVHQILTEDKSVLNKKSTTWWRIAASVLMIGIAAGSLYFFPFPSNEVNITQHHTAQVLQTKPNTTFDSLKQSETDSLHSENNEAVTKNETISNNSVEYTELKNGYYIVVGSTESVEEALKICDSAPAKMLLSFPDLGRIRIATSFFSTYNEAKSSLEVQRANGNPDAWILNNH